MSWLPVSKLGGWKRSDNRFVPVVLAIGSAQTFAQVFRYLSRVPMEVLQSTRNEILLAAACDLIGVSISPTEITLPDKSSVPHWKLVIEMGLRHRNVVIRESAAKAFGSVSRLVDCSDDLIRLIRELRVGLSPMRQSLGTLVGVVDYRVFPRGLENALTFILESVDCKVRVVSSPHIFD